MKEFDNVFPLRYDDYNRRIRSADDSVLVAEVRGWQHFQPLDGGGDFMDRLGRIFTVAPEILALLERIKTLLDPTDPEGSALIKEIERYTAYIDTGKKEETEKRKAGFSAVPPK